MPIGTLSQSRGLRRITALALAAAVSLGLAFGSTAVPAHAASEQATDSTTLRVATSGFVDSFNPFTSIYLLPTNLIRYMYEYLVQNSQTDGSPTKGLAASWTTKESGKQWVYKLQSGLKWSDGKAITAKDVQYTYEQMMNNAQLGTANGNLVTNFASVKAPDDNTVVINLKSPQASNPGIEIPVVPEHIWSKISKPADYKNEKNVVGSGPFLLQSYKANQSIVLKSNPNFWKGEPKIKKIQYIYYTNSDAEVQALKSGDVDLVSGLTPTQYNALKGVKGVTVHSGKGRRYMSLSINPGMQTSTGKRYGTGAAALQDKQVRQAIRLGINIPSLMKHVIDNQGTLATSFIPASFPEWHLSNKSKVLVKYDPDAAKAKLDQAGWKVGSDGYRYKDGAQLKIRLFANSDDPDEQAMAEYLKPWMKAIGINLDVQSSDSDTINDKVTKGDYDTYFTGWSVNPDPSYQLGINTCASLPDSDGTGGTSQDGYCNPDFDKLYNEQLTELNNTKRKATVQKMLELNYQDAVAVDFWYANSLEAYRSDRFTGFGLQPKKDGIIANQAGYWGFLSAKPVAGSSNSSNVSTGLWIGAGVIVLIILIGGGVFFARRRKSDEIE
ncbi:MAG: ABC transporter substrate-binding protein [Microbacteriaceae bacterium]|jgi:peptide/nickel transport system substrate-binding protein|nr:ABC transporter substrate-binding protein [Microbacteriaceae bacterium]